MDTKTSKTGRQMRQYEPVDYLTYGTPAINKNTKLTTAEGGINLDELPPIELEDAPTFARKDSMEAQILKRRVAKTVDTMPVGKAFPVPAKSRSTIHEFLKKEYPAMRFRQSYSKGQPYARFVRLA